MRRKWPPHTAMKNLESLFETYNIKRYEEYGKKDFHDICEQCEYEALGKGFFSRAFRVNWTKWVIKEWRWDIDIPLIFWSKSIHGQPLQKLLSPFSYKFLPSKDESWRQYQDYLLLARYFGFFDQTFDYYPEFSEIQAFQKWIRMNLWLFYDILKQRFGIQITPEIHKKLPIFHNFLPREYIGYGKSISQENKGKETSYIIQEFIKWTPFSEKKIEDFDEEELLQIYLLCIIILIFYTQTGKIPDTRPNNDPKHWGQWFMHTENIFSTPSEWIKMIDTRWLWSVDSNLIKRWIIIPELILQSVTRAAKKIQKILI